jgi:membrane protein
MPGRDFHSNASFSAHRGAAALWPVALGRVPGQYGDAHRSELLRGAMRRTASILWSAAEKFAADDGWAIASYIGLTLLTSLFPFLIFVAALAGFLGSAELAEEAAKLVFAEWPDVVARPIADEVGRVLTAPRGGLLTLGAILSIYFASSAIEALRVGLNRAYGLVEKRPWWLLRLQSLGLVLVGSIALLALAFLLVLGPLILDILGTFLPSVEAAHELLNVARIAIAAAMLATSIFLAHLILPAHRLRLRDLMPGVTLTFIASIVFGEAFGVYLNEYLRNYISMYAGLASVMIALVYLYWVALLFVFGGELNAAIVRARPARQEI